MVFCIIPYLFPLSISLHRNVDSPKSYMEILQLYWLLFPWFMWRVACHYYTTVLNHSNKTTTMYANVSLLVKLVLQKSRWDRATFFVWFNLPDTSICSEIKVSSFFIFNFNASSWPIITQYIHMVCWLWSKVHLMAAPERRHFLAAYFRENCKGRQHSYPAFCPLVKSE